MSDEIERPAFCSYHPLAGAILATACVECGHALALHIGVEHCPVCELAAHNQHLRAAMAADRVEVHVTGVDKRVLERTIEQIWLRSYRGRGHFRR